MKKRFLIFLVCGAALGLLIVSGLSCVSYYQGTTVDNWSLWDEEKFKDFITLDHIVLAKKKADDMPVWVRVSN